MRSLQENITKYEGLLCGAVLKEPAILYDYNIDKRLLSDGILYIGIAEKLLEKGIEVIDEVSFVNECTMLGLNESYKEMGGWTTVKELTSIVTMSNLDSIYDQWTKYNLAKKYVEKGMLNYEMYQDKINNMTSSQLIDFLEYQITNVDINVCTDLEFEDLNLTDDEINDILDGNNIGLNYGKHSPILNYLSLGLPKSDLTMFSSFSNGGKSSYIMNNVVIPTAEQGIKSVIIANEQKSIVYKSLLMTYVLTEKLDYWKLNRKKFKSGNWSVEDKEMVDKAREIIKRDYAPYITFVKVYDYDMNKVMKIAKKLSKLGLEMLVYDTMKYSGDDSNNVWLSLIQDSKDLFQICSKLNLAGVVSFQLAPAMKNKLRTLDETALANGKQVMEVFSEMFAFRDIWDDEWDGEDYDIKPYKLKRDSNGKLTSEKEYIKLDKEKKYKIFFHFKTRNDSVGTAVLYEFKGYQNKWYEVGYCTVHQKNRF